MNAASAAFSTDGRQLLTGFTGGSKKPLTLWDAGTGTELRSFPGAQDRVFAAAFVSGGRGVLSASRTSLLVHEVASGRPLNVSSAYRGPFFAMTASRDGKLALTTGWDTDMRLKIWEVDGLRLRRALAISCLEPYRLAVSPNNKLALVGDPPQLWDLETGKLLHELDPKEWLAVRGPVFSPDSRFALVCRKEQVSRTQFVTHLALWDVATGKVGGLFEGEGGLLAQFSPDGKRVIGLASHSYWLNFNFSGKEPTQVHAWDVASGKVVRSVTVTGGQGRVGVLAFSRDGQWLCMGSGFVNEGSPGAPVHTSPGLTLTVWDLEAGRLLRQWERPRADVPEGR